MLQEVMLIIQYLAVVSVESHMSDLLTWNYTGERELDQLLLLLLLLLRDVLMELSQNLQCGGK